MKIAKVAARQHGVVSSRQLELAGLGRASIHRRVEAGRLHRVHRGVYAVGHPPVSREARWMAAVLACGEGAVLSHVSAAALWGLLRPVSGFIHVSVPTYSGLRGRTGIRLHRCASLKGERFASRLGIPVTSPARTIEDIEGVLPAPLVRRAIRQAEIGGMQLGREARTDRTRSDLEGDFLGLCRRHGLPAPEVNVKVGRWTVDFLWRREGIAVETDFYGYHRGRVAFRDDRARDLDLRRAGFAVHRFSEEQVNDRPAEIAADLRDALALAS
ncbi:MAG: type IV toxin-antitoxin system AbiEi family antitoxin domain-containing protein [Solirubrobacterales bacterium]